MPKERNWIKAALGRGEAVVGLMVSELKTPHLGQMVEAAGLDFAIVDQEHGCYGADALAAVLAGFGGCACRPIVRVPENRREYVLTALELGAQGVMVPHVESGAEAAELVRYGRYAPEGDRGLSLCRAHTGFRRVDRRAYLPQANAEVLLMAQVENRAALDNLDGILATPGLDLAFIGPSDLSASLDIDGSLRSPEMRRVVDTVIAAAKRHGVAVGIQTYDLEVAAQLIAQGVGLVSIDTDANALIGALSRGLAELRKWSGA